MANEIAIRTDYGYVDMKGYIQHHSHKTYREVEHQVRQVLQQVADEDGNTAEQQLEWIGYYRGDGSLAEGDDLFPGGRVIVTTGEGNSEGWIITFLILKNGHQYMAPMRIKYLCNPDLVYEAAKQLSLALDRGLYGYDAPPKGATREAA